MPACILPKRLPLPATMMIALLAALLSLAPAWAQESVDWTGEWETLWRGGGARVILQQEGTEVTGTYPLYNGRIEAVAIGRELRGRWIEEKASGDFVFALSQDGQTFAGRFESGEWWTGIRSDTDTSSARISDQSSPMATMRSFLVASNAAVDGDIEAIGNAVSLVLAAEADSATVDPFTLARAMFRVIDQTTFRLWDLPRQDPDGDGLASARLAQAGTDETFTVDFVQVDGQWFIQAPPIASLGAAATRLAAARNEAAGESAGPLSSPRDTMRSFLTGFGFARDGSDPLTIATLDLRGRPAVTRVHDGQVNAGYLKRVIDRAGYVIWQEIPDDPLATLAYIHFQHPVGNIVIGPVETPEGVIWQFTPDTLRSIRNVYAAIEDMPIADGLSNLPEDDVHFAIRSALRGQFPAALGQAGALEIWQWAGLGLTIMAILSVAWVVRRLVADLWRRHQQIAAAGGELSESLIVWSVRAVAAGCVMLAALWALGLPDGYGTVIAATAMILIVLGLFLLGWRIIGEVTERYRNTGRVTGHNLILISLVSGILRGVLLVVAILAIADALALPVTGVIAGFGIGGIAVALAAQPTLQNLLSGFTLYADRPISVGDFCRFGDKMGTVESIGLRSTRLRTLDRTVISVPNSQFLDMELENFARRDRFLFKTMLQLRYETTPDQMRYLLTALRKLLIAHPMVIPDPMRVRLIGLGEHSLDVELFCYILAPDMDSFAAAREDVLLRIISTVDEAGAQFAFPSVVEYAARDVGPDPDRVREVEAEVESWRAGQTLPFPDFEWQTKAELSGTLDYPPAGSVSRPVTAT